MARKKIFSGSEILAQALELKLKEAGVEPLVKNNIQSSTMSGLGTLAGSAVEVFVEEYDMAKAEPVIEAFKMGL